MMMMMVMMIDDAKYACLHVELFHLRNAIVFLLNLLQDTKIVETLFTKV